MQRTELKTEWRGIPAKFIARDHRRDILCNGQEHMIVTGFQGGRWEPENGEYAYRCDCATVEYIWDTSWMVKREAR